MSAEAEVRRAKETYEMWDRAILSIRTSEMEAKRRLLVDEH